MRATAKLSKVKLSKAQKKIVRGSLDSASIIACAGSGKTATAVKRLIRLQKLICKSKLKSRAALLSFSNVAVNTFRESYLESSYRSSSMDRVVIDTFDGFLTSHVIRPHAHRSMHCSRIPFLVTGSESILQNRELKYWYKLPDGTARPVSGGQIHDVTVKIREADIVFVYRTNTGEYELDNGRQATEKLGGFGAYTHELGKFWAMKTLCDEPALLKVLANRYPYIIVDEAQDLGVLHQAVLELLIEAGSKVSLIGDPNQAIYEFAGADGRFILDFQNDAAINAYSLTTNYRSIPDIVGVANKISNRNDKAIRVKTNKLYGAYFCLYDMAKLESLEAAFVNRLDESLLSLERSSILCRGSSIVTKLRVSTTALGQGRIKLLALASIRRDVFQDFNRAFELVTSCIVGLLKDGPENISAMMQNPALYPGARELRRDIWSFVRSKDGLPSATLKGSTEWHQLTKARVCDLLDTIAKKYQFEKADRLGNKLAKTGLTDDPLIPDGNLEVEAVSAIRVDTVHQAKGETLDAVLYVAQKNHIEAMLDGVDTELGRIGYVALTRARDLFVLGVPRGAFNKLKPRLEAVGLSQL